MIRSLYLCLMTGGALIIYRDVIGVSIVVTVCNTGDNTKLLAVFLGELTAQSFCRSS
jgi:hypothetical protein